MADTLDEFATAAREYCEWCEAPAGDTAKIFRLLSRLVASIVDVHADEGGRRDARAIPHEEWQQVLDGLQLMPFSYYKVPFDPHNLEAATDELDDLLDDLADIWRDLKPALELFDAGHRKDAAWNWRFRFEAHWGRHATSALYALHCWLADHRKAP